MRLFILGSLALTASLFSTSTIENPLFKPLPSYESEWLEPLLDFASPTQGFVPSIFEASLQGNHLPTTENFLKDPSIPVVEKNFNAFCKKPSISKNSVDFSIPPILHFIWLGSPAPSKVDAAISSWKKHHPFWEIRIWTDKNLENFSWTTPHSQQLFEQAKNWSEKSDILRFEILYQFGGVYSDTDVICLKSFDDLISDGLTFFAAFECNSISMSEIYDRPLIGSAMIGSSKGCPILRRAMDYSKTQEEAPSIPSSEQHLRSGPGPLSEACYEALSSSDAESILILPCSYFYPLPWGKRLLLPQEIVAYIMPESFSVHLWEGSWK